MNLATNAALRSAAEQSGVDNDTPPATCQYQPRPCSAPATVLVWIRDPGGLRKVVACPGHVQWISNAVTIVAVAEIRRAE